MDNKTDTTKWHEIAVSMAVCIALIAATIYGAATKNAWVFVPCAIVWMVGFACLCLEDSGDGGEY